MPNGGSRLGAMLPVVENQECGPGRQSIPQAIDQRLPALLTQAQRRRDGRQNKRGVGQGRERDEEDTIGEIAKHLGGSLQCQTCLPRAARADEGYQRDVLAAQEVGDLVHLLLPAQERGRLTGEIVRARAQ